MNMIKYLIVIMLPACFAYDATRTHNETGQEVVFASVTEVQQTCMFSNDRQFLRRLAYMESKFGTGMHKEKLGGIWQINQSNFNQTLQPKYTSIWQNIDKNFHINYSLIDYHHNDLSVPLYNAIATRFFLSITSDPIPWTIKDQANYYVTHYNKEASATNFVDAMSTIPQPCYSPGADILFMLDGSFSITSPNFEIMKNFLKNIVDSFIISEEDYQISVLVFSNAVLHPNSIKFNGYNWNATSLKEKISQIQYPSGGTRTDLALDFALSDIFKVSGGVRPDEAGYPRVGIVITDGASNFPSLTATSAERAKAAGLVLFSVGIGSSINSAELNTIASNPTCMHVYQLQDFAGLSQGFPEELKAQTCTTHAIIQPNNSMIENMVGQNEYMYFQFSADGTVGITFELTMKKGIAALFLSLENSHPNDVRYDFTIAATSSRGSVFISVDQLKKFISKTTNSVRIFCSIKGYDLKNNFVITTHEGFVSAAFGEICVSAAICLSVKQSALFIAVYILNLIYFYY